MSEHETTADNEPASRRSMPNAIFGFSLFALAIVFIFVIAPLGITVPSSVKHLGVSPILLPVAMGVMIACFSLSFALQASIGRGVPQDPDGTHAKRSWWPVRLAAAIGLVAAYYPATVALGMPATAVILTAALIALGGERRLWLIGLISLGFPAGVTLFFLKVASVPIPLGPLFG